MQSLQQRFTRHKTHYIVLLIIAIVAAFLRFSMLQTHAVFFADIGREFLVAQEALETGEMPLVGIATSRPYLHQGPLSLWLTIAVFAVTNQSATAVYFVFAFLGFLAVVALYELLVTTVSNRAALVGATLLAVSPLAVAQSRMAYHTSPIMLIFIGYLWALTKLWEQYSHRWLGISFGMYLLLVQSELSNMFLLGLLGFVIWKKRYFHQKKVFKRASIVLAVLISVLAIPYTIAELRGDTAQLSGVFSAVIQKAQSNPFTRFSRIFTQQPSPLFFFRYFFATHVATQLLSWLIVAFGCLAALRVWREKKLTPTHQLAAVSVVILLISFLLAGGVSEAYLPPVVVAVSILASASVYARKKQQRVAVYAIVGLVAILTSITTYRSEFFTVDRLALQYDAVGEHRAIAQSIFSQADGDTTFITSSPAVLQTAPSYADGVTFFYKKLGASVLPEYTATKKAYLVVPRTAVHQPGTFVIQEFRTEKVLILPARVGGTTQ